MTLKERCRAVVALDRAEVAADAARRDLYLAAQTDEPIRGYWIAYHITLTMLARIRAMPYRLSR